MNIFIIHSGCDKELVEKNISSLRRKAYGANALILKYGGRFWKHEAKSKIKASQALIVFLGKTSYQSSNIGWEIEEGRRQKKIIYTVNLYDDAERHDKLYYENSFLKEKIAYDKTVTIDELAEIVNNFENGEYKIFNTNDAGQEATILEQYKLFLATSEAVVDRRQSTNNFYITVNSALLAFYGVVAALDVDLYVKVIMGAVLSVVGIILCFSWSRIITSYGNLNGSKMKIISLIEKKLPLSLYDAEWAALSDKLNKKKYIPFSNAEKITPILFCSVYIVFIYYADSHFYIHDLTTRKPLFYVAVSLFHVPLANPALLCYT